jgi:hypothetical protein
VIGPAVASDLAQPRTVVVLRTVPMWRALFEPHD